MNVRTRKRNIVVPSDPGSFADAIISIFQVCCCSRSPRHKRGRARQGSLKPPNLLTPLPPYDDRATVQDAAEGESVVADLESGVKVLDSAELDFSRYADTLFEVLFAGGRLSTGGNLAEEQKEKLATCVSVCRFWLARRREAARAAVRCRVRSLLVLLFAQHLAADSAGFAHAGMQPGGKANCAASCACPTHTRTHTKTNTKQNKTHKHHKKVLNTAAERDAMMPYINVFKSLVRRRPFLIKGLEATMNKFILSLEFYDEPGRKRIATATALVFSQKLGALPENVLGTLLNDRLVLKGTVLDFVTTFFAVFLAKDSGSNLDDLVVMLSKARVVDRLLDFMPPSKRSSADFAAHFKAAGLDALVEWSTRRDLDAKVLDLQEGVVEMMGADPAHSAAEVISYVKAKKLEYAVPDQDVARVLWVSLVKTVNMTGKNAQQIMQGIIAKVRAYHKVLSAFVTNARLELALLVTVQVLCYEDNRLLKIFVDIVRMLYKADVLGEDTILHWYKKGSHPKGRNVFLKDIEPFVKWLEEAEEDDGDDEGEEEEAEVVVVAEAAAA